MLTRLAPASDGFAAVPRANVQRGVCWNTVSTEARLKLTESDPRAKNAIPLPKPVVSRNEARFGK